MSVCKPAPQKVVLAYSGGLDASIILKWLQTEYGCEVVACTPRLKAKRCRRTALSRASRSIAALSRRRPNPSASI